ncbi:Mesoderm development candidate 2 [Trichuris trichiura]|uniref:Mesoderm development candidate 2 n=1 Tax=Trichuris trichiura TaxID=36087 RepID=A0A077ZAM1_TRITR|nr:Mesoderm development candidate 2 [Trichuris trichiura]
MRQHNLCVGLLIMAAVGVSKKSLIDYNEADLERLYDQWEEGDDPLEEDELPEWKRPKRNQFDPSKIGDPEELAKKMKKDRTLMIFVSVSGSPSPRELEEITMLWQSSLYNNHIDVQRFVVDRNRAIFMFKDGAQAWEAKDFLLKQDRCLEVSIEGRSYPGKGSFNNEKNTEL